ncbi:MAG: M28 family peptidase [Planctomycetota bacterium]
MPAYLRNSHWLVLPALLVLTTLSWSQVVEGEQTEASADPKIMRALADSTEDVRVFDMHINFLASPFLEGRNPGTPGAEIGRQYVEYYLKKAGLEAAFAAGSDGSESKEKTFRQRFELGGKRTLTAHSLSVAGTAMEANKDFRGLLFGAIGEVNAPVVFANYGIRNGKGEYEGLSGDEDYEGKIVMFFRFEPMDGEGVSLWKTRGPWSPRSSITRKLRNARRGEAAGVIIVNPPGCSDERSKNLEGFAARSKAVLPCPVAIMSSKAAEALVANCGKSLMDLRKMADKDGSMVVDLKTSATIKVEGTEEKAYAYNVGGIIPGRGDLKDQVVVVGAHIDHLGLGYFGSRDRSAKGKIHPGADDNASGTAAILMMAEMMVKQYAALPAGQDARTILFIGFDAEERGLVGAGYYTNNPIVPLKDHTLMTNFDMIGRITDRRIRIDGIQSAEGLDELIRPLLDASPLTIVENKDGAVMMASDHARFYMKEVPVLFSIIDPFHSDYHTPRDTVDKINRVDAVEVIYLYDKVLRAVSLHPERMPFKARRRRSQN